ncbi:MAG TPA: PAS domain S-box protein [Melioribacteraceae bacterium]|nr:PAS domain S-box protein [Melioribacteraceae bacterium]
MESFKNNDKFVKVIIISLVIVVGLLFIWQWIDYYNNLEEYNLEKVKIKLSFHSSEIEERLLNYKSEIFSINETNKNNILELTKILESKSEKKINISIYEKALSKYKEVSSLKYLYLLNKNNKILYSYPENTEITDKKISTRILTLTKPYEPKFLSPQFNEKTKEYLIPIFITIPTVDNNSLLSGKLILLIDAAKYFKLCLDYPLQNYNSNESYLIKKEANWYYFISQLNYIKSNTLDVNIDMTAVDEVSRAVMIKTGIYIGVDYLGEKVVANISEIDKENWYLITKINYEELQASNNKIYFKYYLFTATAVILLILLFVSFKKTKVSVAKEDENLKDYELLLKRLRRGELIAKVGNWEVDFNTMQVFTSLGAREIYGLDESDLTFSDIKKIPLPEYRENLDKEMDNLLRFKIPYNIEFKIRNRKTDKIIDIHSVAVYNEEERKVYGVIKDITEENKIKKQLKEAEERLRFAIEAGNYGVWDMDFETGELFWNESSYNLLGYKNNEIKLTFELWQNSLHPEDLKKMILIFEQISKNSITEFSFEYRIKNKNGDYIWLMSKGKVAGYNNNGKPNRLVGVNINIHDKKTAELELKKIEWMLLRQTVITNEDKEKKNFIFKTDAKGLIYDNINKEILQGIMFDYLQLLESSSIVFERDGSYALGIFQSDWCINLHESKKLRKNLNNGNRCTICFYNEWEFCGKVAIEKKTIVTYKCEAGIEIIGVPIFVFGQVLGSLCAALTSPTQVTEELEKISGIYNLPGMMLRKSSFNYDKRPQYIIELAKERINISAKLIGTLVEKSITERDLFRNRELYKSLVESSDSIIVMIDKKGYILYINNIAAGYYNLSPDKLIGQNLADIFETANLNIQLKYIEQVFNEGTKVVETSTFSILGEERAFRTNIYPVKNKEGEIYAVLVNATDITELKEAETEKKNLEELFYSLMDYFTGGIFIKDRKGVALYVNKYLKDMFNAESWIGKNAIESFPGEIGERLFIDDMNTFEKGYQKIVETIPCLDGKERYYETHKFIIEREGMEPLLGGLTVDITATIKAQQSLVLIKQQQERILNALPDMIFELDNNFVIRWVNTFCEKYFGKEIIGKHINNFVKGIDEQIKIAGNKAIDKVYYYENHTENFEESKYFGWWFKAEFDENDKLVNIIAVARDITNSKNFENKILKLNAELDLRVKERTAELETANKELEAFTYSVSHDLRSPLRAIDGFSRIILEDYSQVLDEEGVRLFNVIRHNTKKMDQLITDLLQLSRVTKQQINKEEIDMTEFINELYDEIANEDTKSKFQFICKDLINTNADKTLMRQVWINLISNAIKYTLPKGNRVIEVSSYEDENYIITKIKDTGVGFNPEYSAKLFGVFQRLHRVEEFEGTGVGLAVVKRIVDKHGGKVWGEGRINDGATFYVAIPKVN